MSVLSDRSVNIPRGAMRASPPTLKTHVVFVGADAHIGPWLAIQACPFSDRSVDIPHGAMRASPPTLKTHVVFFRADAHIGEAVSEFLSGNREVFGFRCFTCILYNR